MDGGIVLETLDSLWFFSNILATPTTSNIQPLLIIQSIPKESPNNPVITPVKEESNEEFPGCGKEPKMEHKKKKKKKKKEGSGERRKRVLDMFIDERKEIEEAKELMFLISQLVKNQTGYSSSWSVRPPSRMRGDDLRRDVMKEHLKSWAHAVACTVK